MPSRIGSTTLPGSSPSTSLASRFSSASAAAQKPDQKSLEVREKFQDFAGGTFFKEMLKSLRSGQKNSKYFYGGQAEEIFRGQLDQQIAETMAHEHGGAFSDPLFDLYSRQSLGGAGIQSGTKSAAEGVHALDVVA
jgi:peptidoglycan hydrolase FlgJ